MLFFFLENNLSFPCFFFPVALVLLNELHILIDVSMFRDIIHRTIQPRRVGGANEATKRHQKIAENYTPPKFNGWNLNMMGFQEELPSF